MTKDEHSILARLQKRLLPPDANGCLLWNGAGSKRTRRLARKRKAETGDGFGCFKLDGPRFRFESRLVNPQAVVWALANNAKPSDVKVKARCPGLAMCCNLDHLDGSLKNHKLSRITCAEATALHAEASNRNRELTQDEIDAILSGEAPRSSYAFEELKPYLDEIEPPAYFTGDDMTAFAREEGRAYIFTDEVLATWRRLKSAEALK